ncbi:cell envelope integrity protein TolA [Lysinibacillus capsici]|uniref:cell envelope integrity protein TolA n=1 Tax=Lysinibacillus capsici TaxID=2115968 RepID=UPI0032DF7312
MSLLLVFLGFLGFIVGLVLIVIGLIKKKKMKGGLVLGISVVIFIVGFILTPVDGTESDKQADTHEKVETVTKPKEETPEEKAAREAKEADEKELAEQKAKEEAERIAKLEALKINGSGDTATKKFKLEKGFVIVDATHQGSSNFAVKLLDANANMIKLVVNEIGNYTGKKIYAVPTGEYQYEVTASGPWTINMSQEIPAEVAPEGKVAGTGDSVVFMNISKGAKTVAFTHDGSRNFVVKANDSVLLANEIGTYSGSKVQKVEDTSIYYFDITADGNWSMTFE